MIEAQDRLAAFSKRIDASYPRTLTTEAVLWRRTMKAVSEIGEVQDAIGGMYGENPRKGVTHTIKDVEDELLDVAVAALGAIEHIHDNQGCALDLLDSHIHRVADRMRIPND